MTWEDGRLTTGDGNELDRVIRANAAAGAAQRARTSATSSTCATCAARVDDLVQRLQLHSIQHARTTENSNHVAFGRSFCRRRASLRPSAETVYTTRGGLSGDTVRATMRISDRSRRRAARVEALTPFKCVRRSTNRFVPTLVRRLNTKTTYRQPSSRASLFAGHRRWRLWDPQACSIWIDLNGLMLNYSSRRKRATRNETLSTTCSSAVYLEARGAAQPQVTPRTLAGVANRASRTV